MKLRLRLLVLFLGIGLGLRAQETKVIRVKAGADARQVIPVAERYRYPVFQQGRITYYNGTSANTRLNYSILLGEMHFIDSKGDTLALANEQTIKQIVIQDHTFYYGARAGFLEEVAVYDPYKLAIKQEMRIVSSERLGGYNQSTGVSAIRTYKSFAGVNGQVQRLDIQGDILLAKDSAYYLIDANELVFKADRSGFMKVFAKKKKEIDAYLKENELDMKKEKDIRQLLLFGSRLD